MMCFATYMTKAEIISGDSISETNRDPHGSLAQRTGLMFLLAILLGLHTGLCRRLFRRSLSDAPVNAGSGKSVHEAAVRNRTCRHSSWRVPSNYTFVLVEALVLLCLVRCFPVRRTADSVQET